MWIQNHQNQGFHFWDVRKIDGFPLEANASLLASKFSAIPTIPLQYLAALAAKYSKKIGFSAQGPANARVFVRKNPGFVLDQPLSTPFSNDLAALAAKYSKKIRL